jgi:rhodanese-related sulfurtransferase
MERIMPCCRRLFPTWSHVFTRETTPAQYRDPFYCYLTKLIKASTVGVDEGWFQCGELCVPPAFLSCARRACTIRQFTQRGTRLPDVGRGALSPELERYFRDHLEVATKSRRDTPVVFYCFADCWMGWNATRRAASWGFTRLYWYRDGIDGWEAAKLPVAEAEPVPDS